MKLSTKVWLAGAAALVAPDGRALLYQEIKEWLSAASARTAGVRTLIIRFQNSRPSHLQAA